MRFYEKSTVSGYKAKHSVKHTSTGAIHTYDFSAARGKPGSVNIYHDPVAKYTTVNFAASGNSKPNHRDAVSVLKTVEKAVRHHVRKYKPKEVTYAAIRDDHDRPGTNRRAAIYVKMAAKLKARTNRKIKTKGSSSNPTYKLESEILERRSSWMTKVMSRLRYKMRRYGFRSRRRR